jgi:hypothetical protein
MRYLLLGDTHGAWKAMFAYIDRVIAKGLHFDGVIQVGDFGAYTGDLKFFLINWKKRNMPLYFIDGNHEDHNYIHIANHNWHDYNVHYMPRGTVKEFENGATIGFIGGACNVDRPQEIYPHCQNFPSADDAMRMITNANQLEKPLDLMIAHSCPPMIGVGQHGAVYLQDGVKKFIEEPLGLNSGPLTDCGEPILKDVWHRLKHKPTSYVYGHFHTIHTAKVGDTNFYCLGLPIDQHLLAFFDTETKTVLT